MKKTLIVLGLVLGLALPAGAADVINGCYLKANGQFRILLPGDRCLASEVTVSFRSATDTSGLAPEVYDANGQFLGVGMIDELYIPSLRKWTAINMHEALGEMQKSQLYYESADCTGQPYSSYENLHRVFLSGEPGVRNYYTAAPELAGPEVVIQSLLEREAICWPIDSIGGAPGVSLAKPIELPFTTPIVLPTRILAPKMGLAGKVAP